MQLDLFDTPTTEIMSLIVALKSEVTNLRRGIFQRYDELKKEQEFLETQIEIMVRSQIETLGK